MSSLLMIEMAKHHQADLLDEARQAHLVREARAGRAAPVRTPRLSPPARVMVAAAGALVVLVGVLDGLPRLS